MSNDEDSVIAIDLLKEAIASGRQRVVGAVANYNEHWYEVEDIAGGGRLRVDCSYALAEFACSQISDRSGR